MLKVIYQFNYCFLMSYLGLGLRKSYEIQDLLNSVDAILRPHGLTNLKNENLLQILLYGHEKLSFVLNTKILEATLKYIQASERFQ